MQYKVKIMKKALGKFLLILLAMSFISSFIPATAFAKSGEDADLKSIEVSCGVLDPEFDGSKTKYTLYIPSDLTQIVITPTPKSEIAKANKINLTLGTKQEPEITVSCTCTDDKKEYTIQIKRIDKTTSEIEKEISQNGYAVYVTNQKFYQKTDFVVCACAVLIGVLIITLLYLFTRKKLIKAYDENEKPFYRID